ncbi:Rhamnogalacturonan exolyase YesX [Planctomycetes bacterium CA13]|uniref:Rhamnogalacturonan exolyase YesX n=1 Tax=Novipirellula herctigrandis TaxID=2527986 RepID=A0A5C5ZBA6_9BACT|nr:Rhamnogalacturonan exolyase YesX [Planctomycetes bacterium CA13]
MLGRDSPDIGFNLYRNGDRITPEPVTSSTNLVDPDGSAEDKYVVESLAKDGLKVSAEVSVWPRKSVVDKEALWRRKPGVACLEIPLAGPPSDKHTPGDMSAGDLDSNGFGAHLAPRRRLAIGPASKPEISAFGSKTRG